MISRLYVLYDASCGFCCHVRRWAEQQPQFVPLEFMAAGSPAAIMMFPEVQSPGAPVEELIVIDDHGGVYRDSEASLMCMYALVEYRRWAERLATPALLPFAGQAFALLSRGRDTVSVLLGCTSDQELGWTLARLTEVSAVTKRVNTSFCRTCD